ncbi:hypothetical protein N0V95_005010 [Ascochyta clinopodiicola]|nr:hypothetical protein N0V95_005010 [Ascochyta clinopodiicola]
MTASYEAVSCHAKTDISISQADNILRIHGFEIDTIAEVIQDTRLLGAWAYMNGHSNNHPTYSPQNPTYALAIQWLLASEDLARRTHHEPGDVTHDLPEEFLMAFWTTDRLDAHARTAYEDASILLVNGDYDTDFSADAKRLSDDFQNCHVVEG